MKSSLEIVRELGYKPILAHVERYLHIKIDELRKLKLNLVAAIEVTSERREELTSLVAGIGNIIARIESSYLSKPSKRKHTRKRTTLPTLPHTKPKEFKTEIIDVLTVLGGSGSAIEVKDIIEERMKDKFLPGDLEKNPSSHMLVWKTHVHRARQGLKNAGILRSDSPTGIWELSEGHK